jgi:hypothetical protein
MITIVYSGLAEAVFEEIHSIPGKANGKDHP